MRGSRANAREIMAEGALRKEWEIFWFERLNKHQEEVLRLVDESKRDASVNLPTGFGKSVVLQALSVQGHPTTVYCKISQSEKQILPRIMYYFIYEIRYNFLKFNLAISHFTRQVRLFFIKKKRKPKIFGFKNMMERGIRKILSFVMHPVNSSCAQSPPPSPGRGELFFFAWIANSRGWGLLSCQIPRGGDETRGQMPCPPSTLQHFSLIAQSSSVILSFLMCDFLFQLTCFLCNRAILIKTSRRDDTSLWPVSYCYKIIDILKINSAL